MHARLSNGPLRARALGVLAIGCCYVVAGSAFSHAAPSKRLAAIPAPQRALAGNEEDQTRRFFALPLPREASARAENVVEHLEAGRFNQALTEMQRLFEDSSGDLLPDTWRAADAEPSIYPSYPGAAGWARALLLSLDAEIQDRYRERFEEPAQRALASALEALDSDGLIAVARRWPITLAAESAWWALGDFEAERGFIETADVAWRRAHRLVAARGAELPPGAARRAALAQALLPPPKSIGAGGNYGASALLDTDVPRADSDRWFAPLDLEPFGQSRDGYPMQPVLSGDQILINTSLRTFSVDAYTGMVRWESELHDSWNFISDNNRSTFFDNVDREQVMIGAAEAQGIVVATMQVPYSEFADSSWQGIPIFRRIPERRLFAFDAKTGAALWDHAPSMRWRGSASGFELLEDNSFEQLSMVAAPPVIAGSRVLVPVYRLQSRIEYHVACFELETGKLIWETQVISGQRERNMFGRAASEFVAAPLVIEGDRVIAQTELGAVAALDLLTGELFWSSEYSQIPIRRNTSYMAPKRMVVWRVAPPVVVDGLVVATPSDSSNLIALELDDGGMRWSFGAYDLQRLGRSDTERYEFDLLIGADENTIYLGGEKVAALQKQGGLRSRLSFQPRWEHLVDRSSSASDSPRPLLTPEVVVIAKSDERLTLDRRTGERVNRLSGNWGPQDRGALVLGDGVLYSLGRYGLVGLFDWQTLISRQRSRLSDSPDDPRVRLNTAALYLRRARALREREGETNEARRFLRDAREMLADRISAADAPEDLLSNDRTAAALLHDLLREEARVLADLTRLEDAHQRLREALELAPGIEAVRDTLLQEEELVRNVNSARRLAVLEELNERVGDLPLSSAQLESTPTWLIGEALLTELDLLGWDEADIRISLWVRLARADELARRRRGEDALVDLHEAAKSHGSLVLNETWTVADIVQERISRRIEIDGPGVYRRFEEEAQAQLEKALADKDEEAMRAVVQRYPFAKAARLAEETMLERSFLARDPERVAELTRTLIQRENAHTDATRAALVRLGLLLQARGNKGYVSGLLAKEAARDPQAEVEVSGALGVPMVRLAEEHAAPRVDLALPVFGSELQYVSQEPGVHEPVGELVEVARNGTVKRLAIFVVETRRIVAYDIEKPERPSWAFNIPFTVDPSKVAIDQGRVIVGSRSEIRAIDERGRLAWHRSLEDELVRSVSAAEGVVTALVGPSRSEHSVVAWDSREGIRLWRVELTDHLPGAVQGWLRPLLGEGRAVVFRRRFTENSTALLIDLHSGLVDAVVDLGAYGSKDILNECAWLEDGRLCVPRFESRGEMGSTLGVYDLEDGTELWRMKFSDDEHFYAVARYAGKSYLVIHSSSLGRGKNRGAVYSLDLDLKRFRPLEGIRPSEISAGLEEGRTSILAAPYLFFVPVEGNARSVPLRILDLVAGRSHDVRLPVAQDELFPDALPAPVVSESVVALVYRTQDPDTQLVARTQLELISRGSDGRLGATTIAGMKLADAGGSYQPVQLRGFGNVLYVIHGNADGEARVAVYASKR